MFKLYQKCVRMLGARCLSQTSVPKPPAVISSKFVTEFNTFYPKLIDRVLSNIKYMEHEEVRRRIKAVAEEYPLIKLPHQGEFMLFVYELLEKPENMTENKIYQGYVLATLQEIIQAYFIIEDDVLDQSETRNLKTCWYLLPGVSNLAINDISLFRSFTFEMLKQTFDENLFLTLMDLTQEGFLKMEMSQHLDVTTKDIKNFTLDIYNRTQTIKAAEYSIVAPIKMALVLSDKANEKSFKLAGDLCYDLGVMVQINNDYTEYLDYRKPFTNKSGTDIKKKVCSWPAVAALKNFNPEQRKIFEENYGKWDSECEKRIVKLYDEVNLDKLYLQERDIRYKRYLKKVEKLPSDSVPSPHVFRQILQFYRSYADDTERYYFS